jgi:hypothetical protein
MRAALDACEQQTTAGSTKACRHAARAAGRNGIRSCRVSRRDCSTCCRESGAACPVGACGNGLVESGEACDGTATGSCAAGCRADCTCEPVVTLPVCGNATVEQGEQCDGAADLACPERCRADCTCGPEPPTCGDDAIDAGEECDGPNDDACPDRCRDDCTCAPPVCGDGLVQGDEECEPSVEGYCFIGCLPDCTCAQCGNGVIESPFEVCEPTDDTACPGSCSAQTCVCLSPTTDSCEAPRELEPLPAVDRQSTVGATIGSADPAFPCGHSGALVPHEGTVWYALTAPGTGRITADTAGSRFDSVLAAYTGTCDALTRVACNDDTQFVLQARIDFPVVGGTRYLLQAAPYLGQSPGDLVLAADFRPCGDAALDQGEECEPDLPETCPMGACSQLCECLVPAADECADAVVATELPIHVRLAAFQSTGAAADPLLVCAPLPPPLTPSTWFRFLAPQDGIVRVATEGSDYDTMLGVLMGECGDLTLGWCDDDSGAGYTSVIEHSVIAGVTYTIFVKPWHLDPADRLELTIAYEEPE